MKSIKTRIAPIFSPSKNPLLVPSFPCLNAPIKKLKKTIINLSIESVFPFSMFKKLNRLHRNIPIIKNRKEATISGGKKSAWL